MDDELEALRHYVAALVDALEWYAAPTSYAITQRAEPRSAVHSDHGYRARQALDGDRS
jgi:hypothetical protein